MSTGGWSAFSLARRPSSQQSLVVNTPETPIWVIIRLPLL